MKRKWVIPVAVMLVLVLVFAGWRALRRRSAGAAAQYATATVERGPLEVTITNTGTLVSGAQQDLRATIAATADQVLAKVGDQVKQGQVLARLSNPDLYTALDQARANLNAEEERLADMVNPQPTATENEIKNAKYRVSQAEYTLTQRQADVDGLTVKSPVTGLVASVAVYPGDQTAAQSTLATVVDLSTLQFIAAVPQESASLVHVGDSVTFFVNSFAYYGKVSTIGPSFSGTNMVTFPVTVSLTTNSGDNGLRPGMSGSYHFPSGPSGSGTVTARTYTLRARTAATVGTVSVNVGDSVTAGQTLMTLAGDTAVTALQQAEVDLDNARTALSDLLAPPVTATATEIASEQAKVAQVRATYQNAQSDVDELTVVAPFDGIITACNIDPGSRVTANGTSAMFIVADFSKMSVNISVDELDVADLKIGMEASVDVQAKPGQAYPAVVSSISPQGTVSQGVATYPVELQLTDPKDLLAGMTANVTITCDRRDDVLFVPVEAVQQIRERSVVRVLDADRKVTSAEVKTGLANDMYIEIQSGLSEGQTVVTGTVSDSSGGMRFPGMGVQSGRQIRTAKPINDGGK